LIIYRFDSGDKVVTWGVRLSVRLFTLGFRSITPKEIMWSTLNLVCDLPVSKGRRLLIFGHIGKGKKVTVTQNRNFVSAA